MKSQVLSEIDIFSVVGGNKPLQLVDARVPVTENGVIVIRFDAVVGSPIVCGICIRKASKLSGIYLLFDIFFVHYYLSLVN